MAKTLATEHVAGTTRDDRGLYQRSCTCGWTSAKMGREPSDRPCPNDPTVRQLATLQFAQGGLFDSRPTDSLIHLVRGTARGTPGPTLCGIDRFAKDSPGWSVGGGCTAPGMTLTPCTGCADVAQAEYPGLPVWGGVGGREMAALLAVPHVH